MIEIHGLYSDGTTSRTEPATLELVNPEASGLNSVRVSKPSGSVTINAKAISISSRLGSSARYLDLGEFGRFETRDNDAVDELDRLLGGHSGFIHKLESNLSLIFIAAVVAVVFTWGVTRYGIPAAADLIVDSIPATTRDLLDQKVLEVADENLFAQSELSPERQRELTQLFADVSSKLQVSEKGYRFLLRKGGYNLGANALAFPSGTIVMTDELVLLATNEKQIAGVIAHELGHLEGKHSLRQLVRGSILTFIVAAISGDVSNVTAVAASAPTLLLELQYSREFELQADKTSIQYLACDTEGLVLMADFLETLTNLSHIDTGREIGTQEISLTQPEESDSHSMTDFLSTHPATATRRASFLKHATAECP